MDNLQEAYTAYQQALYYLPDPKVFDPSQLSHGTIVDQVVGAKTLVWNRNSIRSIRIARSCRGSLFTSHANAARL
jgi:hypothetical protein